MIIDNSYFLYKPLFIPQSSSQIPSGGTGYAKASEEINYFIQDKESEFLLSFLGYEQYTELLSQFNAEGSWKDDALEKWIDLVDGKEDWKGLRYSIGSYKKSIIAYYVYFYWLLEDNKTNTVMGQQKPESANSTSLIPNDSQSKVWNDMLKMYGFYPAYNSNPVFFTNWNGTGIRWIGSNMYSNVVTLYDFMVKNNDVYDTSKFTNYQPVNPYNL